MVLFCNDLFHWLGANLDSAPESTVAIDILNTENIQQYIQQRMQKKPPKVIIIVTQVS